MHNYWRAIQLTLKYKWNVVGVIVASLCLALCWGGNIATVYPLVQVSFQGESLNSWLSSEIQSQAERIERLKAEKLVVSEGVDPDDDDAIAAAISRDANSESRSALDESALTPRARQRLSVLQTQIDSAETRLSRFRRLQPIVVRWTPDDPFLTVVLLMVYVIVVTAIKGVSSYIHSFLSARLGQLGSLELRSLFFKRMLGYETTFFSRQGISDATTRFTSDMGTLSNGLTLAYGKALREPLKLDRRRVDSLACEVAQTGRSAYDGGNGAAIRSDRRDVSRNSRRQIV